MPIAPPNVPMIEQMLGEYVWLLFMGFLLILVRTAIESAIAGLLVFLGDDLDDDMTVYLDGGKGRIVRKSIFKTTFYMYEYGPEDLAMEKPLGGKKMVVSNTRLKDMNIMTELSKI